MLISNLLCCVCSNFGSETALDHTDDIFLALSETCVFMLWREFVPGFILIHCMFFYIQYSVNIGLSKEPISNCMYFADVSVQTNSTLRQPLITQLTGLWLSRKRVSLCYGESLFLDSFSFTACFSIYSRTSMAQTGLGPLKQFKPRVVPTIQGG